MTCTGWPPRTKVTSFLKFTRLFIVVFSSKNYLKDSLRKDVKYLGLKSQNELSNIIGKELIQIKITEEKIEAGVFSISADEATACNDEILSICLRYVNNDNETCEVFMGFVELERITGEAIENAIIKF